MSAPSVLAWQERESRIMLSTGRTFYAHGGVLGLAATGADIVPHATGELHYGYDGTVCDADADAFTEAERSEIAAVMVARWRQWGGL